MKGYVARKGNRWYAVIYEGLDPITGRERRSWHPAGCERGDAERLAARLVSEREGANDEARSLSFGAFLTSRWLPGKRLVLAASTYNGYRRNVEGHIVPALGRIGLRRLRPHRGLIAIDYEVHETRGKTPNARRRIDLDPTTVSVITAWRHWQQAEQRAAGIETAGWMFTDGRGEHRPTRRCAGHPAARLAPHPRHAAHRRRRSRQGRQRTTRPRHANLHDRDLPARASRHASRRGPRLRTARRARWAPGRPATGEVGENPREAPEEDCLTVVEAQVDQAPDLGFFVAGAGFEPATSGL